MAQLKDTVVAGSLRATDTLYASTGQFRLIKAATSSSNPITSTGTSGQILRSGGTSSAVYWDTLTLSASDIPTITLGSGTTGTLPVNQGGTGATSFTANSVIISGSGTTSPLTTRAIYNRTSKGNLEWTNSSTDTHIVTKNTLAYWDGRYNSSSSNLTYCIKGEFGNASTYAVDDATSNGALSTGTALTTERSVYYGLVTVNNADQTRATGIYAPTSGGTADTQALVSNGASNAPKWVNIGATITIGAGTSSAAPTVNVTVLGQSGTAQSITTASTSVYGVTKLSAAADNASLAATAKSVYDLAQTVGGLSNAMHFIGIATVAYTASNFPNISGYSTPTAGDVVIDQDKKYEYVYIDSTNKWELLGGDESYALSSAVINKSIITAKGDIIYGNADSDPTILSGNTSTTVKFLKMVSSIPTWEQISLSNIANAQDIQAIEGISETSGLLKKTAANTWTLDTTSYCVIGSSSTQAMAGNTTTTNVSISADTTTSASYPLVFGTTNTTAAKIESLQKNSAKFYVNPSSGNLVATKFNNLTLTANATGFAISGGTTASKSLTITADYTLAAACAKGVDTSISAGSSSTNVPTTGAVASFVEGKGYVTSSGVTSVTITQGAGITVSDSGTAITSTGTRTISISGMNTSSGSTTSWLNQKGEWSTPKTSELTNDSQFISGIPYAAVDSTSTSTAYTATVSGITELKDGTTVMLRNGIITSAAGFTININGLGAYPVYSSMSAATAETTIFNANYTMLFVFDTTRVSGGCWVLYRGYDSNTNTIGYQLRTNSTVLKTTDRTRYYRMLFTSADGTHWVPANTQYDNSATSSKTVNQRPIDPFGRIVYLANATNYTAETDVSSTAVWDQYLFSLGYSFNNSGAGLSLTVNAPVYIKCAPYASGGAIIDSTTPYVQALPSTADGKIYIFLGIAYSETQVELVQGHPVYYHDGSGIRLWTGRAIVNMAGATSSTDGTAGLVPASAAGDQVAFLQGDATWYKLNVRNGTGTNSIIIGNSGRAVGDGSVAEGTNTYASGTNAHAEGEGFSSFVDYFGATGNNSHSEGTMTTASGGASHAEGVNTKASGSASHAEGSVTEATAFAAHAEGGHTTASEYYAHAEGYYTTASGYQAHAEGYKTIANHKSQHVFGEFNIGDTSTAENTARGTYIEIVGKGTGDSARSNARTLDWNGNETLAGNLTINGTTLTLGNISITATQLQTLVNLTAAEGVNF